VKSRPLSGRSWTCFGWITLLSAVDTVSSNGELPVTVTVSATCDRPIFKSTDDTRDTLTSTCVRTVWNPCSAASTVYMPSARSGNEKSPLSDVVVVRDAAVAVFVAVIVTPGSTAPVWSATRPVMPPRNVWASASAARASTPITDSAGASRCEMDMTISFGSRRAVSTRGASIQRPAATGVSEDVFACRRKPGSTVGWIGDVF
jgi:hypothetical protein